MADKTAHKERTRARILDEASQALRLSGTEGVSVGALMKRAGLTHGGFYAHFSSRDDLVAHAIDRMFQDSAAMLDRFLPDGAGVKNVTALIDHYLSEHAMAAPERGCPLPGLTGEARRMPAAARARFETGVNAFLRRLESALSEVAGGEAHRLATTLLSEMVGAMALARSTRDRKLALDILQNSQSNLKVRLGQDHGDHADA